MAWSGLLDFSKLPKQMISGLETHEIQKLLNQSNNMPLESNDEFEIVDLNILNYNLCDDWDLDFLEDGGESVKRFGNELNIRDVQELNKNVLPKNTSSRNKWATKIFEEWFTKRGDSSQLSISSMSDEELNKYLPCFVHEVRRRDGARYPAQTLVSIIAGIQGNISQIRPISFFRDDTFKYIP